MLKFWLRDNEIRTFLSSPVLIKERDISLDSVTTRRELTPSCCVFLFLWR